MLRKKYIQVFECSCVRCGRDWDSKLPSPPKKCPWCGSRNYHLKPGEIWKLKKKSTED